MVLIRKLKIAIITGTLGLVSASPAMGEDAQPTMTPTQEVPATPKTSAQIYDGMIEAKLYERYQTLKKYDEPTFTRKDPGFFIPQRMRPTGDLDLVQEQVIYHTAQNALAKLRRGNNVIGRTVKTVSKAVKTDLNFEAKTGSKQAKDEVTHKFNIDMELFSRQAKLTYKGFVDASMTYLVEHEIMSFYVTEKLTNSLSLHLAHHERPNNYKYDHVSLKWVF